MFESRGPLEDSKKPMEQPEWQVAGHDRIQQLGERPLSPMRQTPHHQRSATEDLRRPPIPKLRSRSNTSTSNDISFRGQAASQPSLETSDSYGSRNLNDRRSLPPGGHLRGERSESLRMTLMKKGSRLLLKRQNSQQNLTSLRTVDWSQELDESPYYEKSNPMDGTSPAGTPPVEQGTCPGMVMMKVWLNGGTEAGVRWNISEPFDFQHLTHTEPIQFKKIQEASTDEIASDLCAIRAAQTPRRELRGIRAEHIPRPFSSAGSQAYNFSRPPGTAVPMSRPATPPRSRGPSPTSPQPSSSLSSHKAQVSIDSFTGVSLASQQEPVSPLTPPPRTSSRHCPPDFFTQHQGSPTESDFEASVASEDDEPYDFPIATWNGEFYDFTSPHAVTTPGDAAHVLPPPFQMCRTELSRVVEEDECSDWRSSVTTMTSRSSVADSTLRHPRSPYSARHFTQPMPEPLIEEPEEPECSPTTRSIPMHSTHALIEDTLNDIPYQAPRASVTVKDSDGNWEDLVDWCYEHAAEADSNFDFTRASLAGAEANVPELSHTRPASVPWWSEDTHSNELLSPEQGVKYARCSSVYSSPSSPLRELAFVPDSEPQSAVSGQSSLDSVCEAITPTQSTVELPAKFATDEAKIHAPKSVTSPTPFIPTDLMSQEVYEDLCQEMYTRHSVVDSRNQFYVGHVDGSTISSMSSMSPRRSDGSIVSSMSPRSSRAPLSKSSSQESFWARQHRNSNSGGSLPELVPSRNSREKRDSIAEESAEAFPTLSKDAVNTVGDLQSLPSFRRTPSLVKNVAQKNLLSRVITGVIDDATNAEVPLPLHPALRDRAGSDAAFRDPEPFVPPFARPAAQRMRSASSASSLKNTSPRASRASYGLFPKTSAR